ncbi:MAG: hypothetical protein FWD94_01945 [Treponema sp.]|nr:hypothetical protein [Treponema sp.]
MRNEIVPFKFEGLSMRHIVLDGRYWFAAQDILDALEYSGSVRPSAMMGHVPDEWKGIEPFDTPGGTQKLLCLSEEGLYFFAARSDKRKAIPFQKWVVGKLLPQIRKTGAYLPDGMTAVSEQELRELLIARSERNTYKKLWIEERREVRRHENRNFLSVGDKREILALHVNGYPLEAIRRITKKGRIRIRNFIDGVTAMDDGEMDGMLAEWRKAEDMAAERGAV